MATGPPPEWKAPSAWWAAALLTICVVAIALIKEGSTSQLYSSSVHAQTATSSRPVLRPTVAQPLILIHKNSQGQQLEVAQVTPRADSLRQSVSESSNSPAWLPPALVALLAPALVALLAARRRPPPLAAALQMVNVAGQLAPEDLTVIPSERIRNIAIVAHVDHGKTTLVDKMLGQSHVFRDNQVMEERIMDSNALEKERGITILSKNTAVRYKDYKINVIDTPGHADFGGEVERILNMVDGVVLLVDAREGPMPQTRFVTKKALALGKKVVVVVNKVDREGVEPEKVVDSTFELFVDLAATEEQLDFPVVYASGMQGVAGYKHTELAEDLVPLFETILSAVPAPQADPDAPLQMLVANLDYDTHKGRIALGRVQAGCVRKAQAVTICTPETKPRNGKVAEIFVFDNFARKAVVEVAAGDICGISGLPDIAIGETVCEMGNPLPLPTIQVEEPTVRMTFMVNTSEFAGREGKFVTSRNLKERLDKELERNLALRVEAGETADEFVVCGRGTLHLSILIENMRREGYEFAVGPPQVITRATEDGKLEPYELAYVEAKQEHIGSVIEILGQRCGQMEDLTTSAGGETQIVKYRIPTRGLIGVRNLMLTASKGTAVLNTIADGYDVWAGEINTRATGSLLAYETGQVTSYAVSSAQDRGILFVKPGDEVYANQVVGIHQRPGDLPLNVCKRKAATNVRSNKDNTIVLSPPKVLSLDDNLEYIANDELVEVTPKSMRLLKNPKFLRK